MAFHFGDTAMAQTLVALFNSFAEASQAADRLAQEGIVRSDMNVHAQESLSGATDDSLGATDGVGTRTVVDDGTTTTHEHLPGGIADFFKHLFGNDDRSEEAGHYQESVRRGHALLTVDVADESRIEGVRAALGDAGAIDIDERVAQWKSSGYNGYDNSAPAYTPDEIVADRQAFAVVKEELAVGKREVTTGGVRVYSRLTETPVTESVNLREEHASIERHPVDRPATEADFKQGFVEIRESAEEAVVAKTARVTEEVVVGKESSNRTETVNDTVRGTDVQVERISADQDTSQRTDTTLPRSTTTKPL
jgi:uncharacterized protein (TIGR02271 family)